MPPNVTLHAPSGEKSVVVVIGLGMVGLSFIEKLLEYDTSSQYQIITFSEETLRKDTWYCYMKSQYRHVTDY